MKAAHRSINQTRKDGIRLYEIHPLEVFGRFAAVSKDEDGQIAALLHDVIEDVFPKNPAYNIHRINNEFGDNVANLVLELTDEFTKENYPDKNRRERKQSERERMGKISLTAKTVKLADITTNLLDDGNVTADGSFGGPDVGFNRMYILEKEQCLPYLFDKDGDLAHFTLFGDAVEALKYQANKFDVRLRTGRF